MGDFTACPLCTMRFYSLCTILYCILITVHHALYNMGHCALCTLYCAPCTADCKQYLGYLCEPFSQCNKAQYSHCRTGQRTKRAKCEYLHFLPSSEQQQGGEEEDRCLDFALHSPSQHCNNVAKTPPPQNWDDVAKKSSTCQSVSGLTCNVPSFSYILIMTIIA